MKFFWIPAAVLSLLLGASLWNARFVAAETEVWRESVEAALAAAEDDDWDAALRAVRAAKASWDARKPYLHIVTAHDELDRVDELLAETESFAIEREAAEFRASAAELTVQLDIVSKLQQLTLRNVL